MEWVEQNQQMMIAGHTHRPVFPTDKQVPYYNLGCCVYPRSICGIEIEKGNIMLVKWKVEADNLGVLRIDRKIMEGPRPLTDFVNLN